MDFFDAAALLLLAQQRIDRDHVMFLVACVAADFATVAATDAGALGYEFCRATFFTVRRSGTFLVSSSVVSCRVRSRKIEDIFSGKDP
jgi:hypothetical protein